MNKVVKRYNNFNSTIKKVYYILDGERHGEYIENYENGNINIKSNYINGLLHGEYIKNYENGNIHIKSNYANGLLQGEYLYYTSDGLLKITCNYDKGRLHGAYNTYHNGVTIISKTECYAGFKHGKESIFRENGTLLSEATYENGILNGSYFSYRDDGLSIYGIVYFVNNINKICILASDVSYKRISYVEAIFSGLIIMPNPLIIMIADDHYDPIISKIIKGRLSPPKINTGFNGLSIVEQNELVIEEFQKQLSLINK